MKFKNYISAILITYFLTVFFVVNSYSYIKHNGIENIYEEGVFTSSIQSIRYESIEYYIMEGGGYYLEADTHIQALLKLVELKDIQGINYFEMIYRADSAWYYLTQAADNYEKLIGLAENTPYNQTAQEKLRIFDYDTFAANRHLNGEVFSVLKQYLQNGNITGILQHTYVNIKSLVDIINKIRVSLYQYRMPSLSLFWQLNENQAASSLLGSYTARVFTEISK